MSEHYKRRVTVTYEMDVEFDTEETLARSSTATAVAEALALTCLNREGIAERFPSGIAVVDGIEDEDGTGTVAVGGVLVSSFGVMEIGTIRLSHS